MMTASNVSTTTLSPPDDGASVVALMLMGAAIVTAVGGNVLVLKAYWWDPLMRTVHNLYIVHLAVCDLLIGAVLMPLYLVYTVHHWAWPLGALVCKLFLSVKFMVGFMSLVVIVLVVFDRLAMITDRTSCKLLDAKSRRRAYVRLGVGWLCSSLLFSPAILLWDVVAGVSVVPADECDTEFHEHMPVILVTDVIFGVPVVALLVLHVLIYMALRARRKLQAGRRQRARAGSSFPAERGVPASADAQPETVQLALSSSTEKGGLYCDSKPETSHPTAQSCAERVPSSLKAQPETTQLSPWSSAEKRVSFGAPKPETSLPTAQSCAKRVPSSVKAQAETAQPTRSSSAEKRVSFGASKPETSHPRAPSCAERVPSSVKAQLETAPDNFELTTLSSAKTRASPSDTASSSAEKVTSVVEARPETTDNQENRVHVPVLITPAPEAVSTASYVVMGKCSPSARRDTPVTVPLLRQGPQEFHIFERLEVIKWPQRKLTAKGPQRKLTAQGHQRKMTLTLTQPSVPCKKGQPGSRCRRLQEKDMAVMGECLVLALIVCWLPYSLATVVLAACASCGGRDVHEIFTWLLWFKACLDPLLYTFASRRFCLNVRQICRCKPSKWEPCPTCGSV